MKKKNEDRSDRISFINILEELLISQRRNDVRFLSRFDKIIPFLLVIFVSIIYIYTMFQTIPGGDSAEFISVASKLGVAHPPGYPLYTILGKVFSFIPIGSFAWRINFFAVVTSLVALWFLFKTIELVTNDSKLSFVISALFAFSPLNWFYSIQAEVFAMNNMFVVIILYLAIKVNMFEKNRVTNVILGSFISGLALSNHHCYVFFGLPLSIYVLIVYRKDLLRAREITQIILGLLVGLLPYLYLILADNSNPDLAWGDPSSFKGLLNHILRKEYGTFQLGSDVIAASGFYFYRIGLYLVDTLKQFLFIFPIMGLFSIIFFIFRFKKAPFWCFLAIIYFFYLLVFIGLNNLPLKIPLYIGIQSRFWMQPNIILLIAISIFIIALLNYFKKRFNVKQKIFKFTLYFLGLLIIMVQLGSNFNKMNYRNEKSFYNYGKSVLESMPENSIIFTNGDLITNVLRYLQSVEGIRKDIKTLNFELMTFEWYIKRQKNRYQKINFPGNYYHPFGGIGSFSLQKFLNANIENVEIYNVGGFKEGDEDWKKKFDLFPTGILHKITRKSERFDVEKQFAGSIDKLDRIIKKMKIYHLVNHDKRSWEYFLFTHIWKAYYDHAVYLLKYSIKNHHHKATLKMSTAFFEEILKINPETPAAVYQNLWYNYFYLSKTDKKFITRTNHYKILFDKISTKSVPEILWW